MTPVGTSRTGCGPTCTYHAASRRARLRHAILGEAFAGRLVPQDPIDEPASVLLDRIRVKRATAPVKTKRSRAKGATQLPL